MHLSVPPRRGEGDSKKNNLHGSGKAQQILQRKRSTEWFKKLCYLYVGLQDSGFGSHQSHSEDCVWDEKIMDACDTKTEHDVDWYLWGHHNRPGHPHPHISKHRCHCLWWAKLFQLQGRPPCCSCTACAQSAPPRIYVLCKLLICQTDGLYFTSSAGRGTLWALVRCRTATDSGPAPEG